MKPGGVPDETRAARLILKDFVTGKLLVCKAPPGYDQGIYLILQVYNAFTPSYQIGVRE